MCQRDRWSRSLPWNGPLCPLESLHVAPRNVCKNAPSAHQHVSDVTPVLCIRSAVFDPHQVTFSYQHSDAEILWSVQDGHGHVQI